MAVIQQFSVDGFPELFAAMDKIKEEIGKGKTDKIYREAMKAAFTPVLNAAKDKAPKDTGQLADHIYMKVHRPTNSDKKSKYYERGEIYMARVSVNPLRDDSQLHYQTRTSKKGKVYLQPTWRNKKPVAVSQEFGNARVPKHPFLRTSLEGNAKLVTDILGDRLKLAIDEFARKAARGK
jgi:HK97 gp10 family phage protein